LTSCYDLDIDDCVDTPTSNDIPYTVMSGDISLIVDLQSYARQLNILTNRTLAPGVCSALIPQEMVISSLSGQLKIWGLS
jgi:hypothetical protein